MTNTTNTKNNATQKTQSTMNTLKRARTLNFYNDETKCTETIKVIAESEKAYKTDDNKVVKKSDVEKKQVLKNTVDYRFITDEEDNKYNKIQENLCSILEIDKNTSIKYFETLFNVRQTKKALNVLVTESVLLNRAKCLEILLTKDDNEKVKEHYETRQVLKTEIKLNNYMSHYKDDEFYSLELKTKKDIEKVAKLLRQ